MKTIVVTSQQGGVGKSTLPSDGQRAQENGKTLPVAGNLFPSRHSPFGLSTMNVR
jgi:hypothetical protein